MKKVKQDIVIQLPKKQLNLFGYEKYFNLFIKMFESKKLPNTIMLSGPKGAGKSTFAFHFTNYLLSKNEKENYKLEDFTINESNSSYKLVNAKAHPNFLLIENSPLENDIKIEKIRSLINFLSKSTYLQNLKIVIVDNVEHLNINSANALLKAIEEPNENTYFFLIHNNSQKILETIKSRCIKFNFFHNFEQKKQIFKNLALQYNLQSHIDDYHIDDLYFDSPGNLLNYSLILKGQNLEETDNLLVSLSNFIDIYKKEKKPEILYYIRLFISKFYHKLCKANLNLSSLFINQSKIFKQIHDMKKYNLNEKSVLNNIEDLLKNETK